MADDAKKTLTETVSMWSTAYFLSKAMLDDYALTMSKIEGTTPQEIKDRITKDTEKRFAEYKKSLPKTDSE